MKPPKQTAAVLQNTDFAKAGEVWIGNPMIGLRFDTFGKPVPDSALIAGAFSKEKPEQLTPFPNPFEYEIDASFSGKPTNYEQQLDLVKSELSTSLVTESGLTVKTLVSAPLGTHTITFNLRIRNGTNKAVSIKWKNQPQTWLQKVQLGAKNQFTLENFPKEDVSIAPGGIAELRSTLRAPGPNISDLATIELDGPVADQQAINSFLWTLNSNAGSQSMPPGPFGLTNTKYGGRIFWDSDIWMFPALMLTNQNAARSIADFRLKSKGAAMDNAWEWIREKRMQYHPAPGQDALKFAWEAGPNGGENAPEESQRQHHITADVAHMLTQASALGLVAKDDAEVVTEGCAIWLWKRATRDDQGKWGIEGTMSPDEFAVDVNNDLYTNVMTEAALVRAFPDRWKPGDFKRPKDETTFLTYENDKLRGYKQAAALLAIWPAQDPTCEREAAKMLSRFAGKSTKNGPAMSKSVEALIEARFGDPERAIQTWRQSWQAYTTRSLMMFAEAPNGKNAIFLTGAAGCLDAFLYGFLGFRLDQKEPKDKPWKMVLNDGWWVSAQPNLPTEWKSVVIKNVNILDKRFTFSFKGKQVEVENSDRAKLLQKTARDSNSTVK